MAYLDNTGKHEIHYEPMENNRKSLIFLYLTRQKSKKKIQTEILKKVEKGCRTSQYINILNFLPQKTP